MDITAIQTLALDCFLAKKHLITNLFKKFINNTLQAGFFFFYKKKELILFGLYLLNF